MFNSKRIEKLEEELKDIRWHEHCSRCGEVMCRPRCGFLPYNYDKDGKLVCFDCIFDIGKKIIKGKK